jgi:hypothetical protein
MASTLLSPGIRVTETDLTTTIPAVSSSTGAFAGIFGWGPVNEVTQVTNENDLVTTFGKPTDSNYASFFSAANFLSYANNLLVVRSETAAMKNAGSTGTAILVKNLSDYESKTSGALSAVGPFIAKYPGTLGNSLKVSMVDAATFGPRTLAGTVSITANSNAVVGTGTAFDTAVVVGDILTITSGGTSYTATVTTVTSATALTLSTSVSTSAITGATVTAAWEYSGLFSAAPYDSNQAVASGATGDGLHIVVVDVTGAISGTAGTVLEKFSDVSKASNGLRYDGTSGYYKIVLNQSKYVWWASVPSNLSVSGTDFGAVTGAIAFKNLTSPVNKTLSGGVDDYTSVNGNLQTAFSLFTNTETTDISLVFVGDAPAAVAKHAIQNIAEYRQDCVAFVSPSTTENKPIIGDTSTAIDAIKTYRNTTLNVSSTYAVMDSGYKYQYDKYNDVFRWVPLNADIAGLCARTDYLTDPWFSPAGLNRGQIKNVVKLAVNPNKAQRDDLFKIGVNPVVSFPGQGVVLYGDKTLSARPSAFDAINVRRLFISVEKAISAASKFFLFELNTDLTRQLFSGMIVPYLRDIQGRQGITDFLVDVSSQVNTPEVIDSNELRANIFIKPSRSIRTIQLSFIATRTGAVFTELEV